MGKSKLSLIKIIRLWGIFSLLVLTAIVLVIFFYSTYREAADRAGQMRTEYIEQQRRKIRSEVERVAELINIETVEGLRHQREKVRSRVHEAWAIADNIFSTYRETMPPDQLREMITDAIRPIRFDRDSGYYFITRMDGVEQLFADRPDLEGQNMLDVRDIGGKYVVRDMIDLVRSREEGFYQYHWSRPANEGQDFRKLAYVKHFAPFDWLIGTGIYLDSVETELQGHISQYINTHRFGPNRLGYVFILDLLDIQGGKDFAIMYANPNRPDLVGRYISDDLQDAEGKMFRKEFLQGLRERGECYVDYWYKKFDNPQPSPKTSFFKLAGEGRFIVAAGVYLDDVEEKIALMQSGLKQELQANVLFFVAVIAATSLCFILLLNWLSSLLRTDVGLFTDFFGRAAHSAESIDRGKVRFKELDRMAEFANQMLSDKALAEKALLDEREQLLVTLYSIVDGVMTTGVDGAVELMNPVAETLTGWSQAEAAGKMIDEIFIFSSGKSDQPIGREDLFRTEGPEPVEFSGILRKRDGSELQVLVSSAPIHGTAGELLGEVLVFRDETERLKTEQELFKAKKLESVGLLAGGIAHDFNNILAGLFGNIELAQRKTDPEHAAYPHIQIANKALERACGLTRQLLTFAKGGDPLLEAVSLRQVIDGVVTFNLSGSSIKAVIDLPGDLWPVKADKGQLGQVLSNLIINAKHAMPNGGHLYFSGENMPAAAAGGKQLDVDFVRLLVRDEGIGMTGDLLEKIFDPYFSTKQTGSGLGLAMVRSIVEKHRGEIEVASRPGQGSTFMLFLPAESVVEGLGAEQAAAGTLSRSGDKIRVLVIDDERIVRDVFTEMLQMNEYSVSAVAEGAAGRDEYRRAFENGEPYNLVITDLTIPGGLGGKEMSRDILNFDPQARIIATSGYATDPIMANYTQFGFSGRIVKPFEEQILLSEVARVLNQS